MRHLMCTFVFRIVSRMQIRLILRRWFWNRHSAHDRAHTTLNENLFPSKRIKSEFSGIHWRYNWCLFPMHGVWNRIHIFPYTEFHFCNQFGMWVYLYLCIRLADKIRSNSKYYIKFVHLLGCNKKKRYLCSVDSR